MNRTLQYFKIAIYSLFFSFLISACGTSGNTSSPSGNGKGNHLVNQSSPYLLQHAYNPVDWYPWDETALQKAKEENKMVVISVGYAACHWCHVMEHESFEDTTVSRIMNEHFVSIKVDREERPDVDDVYMTACHLASGRSCGWPLNAFALPDGRPVWAGTYFPKEDWLKVLENFVDLWQNDPDKLEEYATQLTEGISSAEKIELNPIEQEFKRSSLDEIASNFMSNIDFKEGGRKGEPKFPMPNNYQFLLKYHYLSKDAKALEAVTTTLDKMAFGGIYDHLGGGFARYSVDGVWKVPHFEKMLYDNGQLVSLYANAYQLTKNPLYKQVVDESLAFIERELTDENGGFYSSLDADSEGEEGKFYVWHADEINTAISNEKDRKIFNAFYEVTKNGNWEEHKNILYRKKTTSEIAKKFDETEEEINSLISNYKQQLFDIRDKRVRPGLDDKILTSWNALMLKAYVDAYKATQNEAYLNSALKNANFLVKNMLQDDFRLNRNYKDGKSVINAFLDDYALLSEAFIALYEVTFDEEWLNKANRLVEYAQAHFYDESNGMFNYTSDLDPPLVAVKKELSDNVIPASNSSMARVLHLLGTYLYDTEKLKMAKQMMNNLASTLEESKQPNFYSNWCQLYQSLVQAPYEVAIIGDDFKAKRDELMQNYLPHALLLGGKDEGSLELLKDKLQEGETMIYVCQNKVCKLPVTDVDAALKLMQ